jgi:ABC-type Fe3+/spermidine/putrescine transport system ATPase subunit
MAVRDVSLEVEEGEILTLLGPSGCGKTTSLRMIAGLERCSEGEITFKGKVVDSVRRDTFLPTNKRNIGMVFQSYAIWPNMSVFENIAFPLRVRGLKENEITQEVTRVLQLVGLEHFGERSSTQLSGGQQQRVALARSLVFNPSILLLDEPFSNLDAKLRENMRLEMKLLQQRIGVTIVIVTHDQTEALSLSDRIVVMNRGAIEQVGAPQELYENPRTPFVRDFLGQTIRFAAAIDEVGEDGSVAVRVEGAPAGRYSTRNHFLTSPQRGQPCYLIARPGDIEVEAADHGMRPKEGGDILLSGKIDTLLFLGEYFEALIRLPNERTFVAALPRKTRWRARQEVVIRLPQGGALWQE